MAIRPISEMKQGVIDLTGPQGNAFVLLGTARSTADALWDNPVFTEEIINDMMSGDYEHLLEVFDKHFGDIYTLYR